MGEYLKRMGGKLILVLVAGGALIGYKMYQRGASATETRTELIALCAEDAECKNAVEKHFESCHEQAYKLGGRRQAGGLDTGRLTSCINSAAGAELFAVQ